MIERHCSRANLCSCYGDTSVVERRILARQSEAQPATYLASLQQEMRALYEPTQPPITQWMTTDWTAEEARQTFARRVYAGKYEASDLQARLEQIAQ